MKDFLYLLFGTILGWLFFSAYSFSAEDEDLTNSFEQIEISKKNPTEFELLSSHFGFSSLSFEKLTENKGIAQQEITLKPNSIRKVSDESKNPFSNVSGYSASQKSELVPIKKAKSLHEQENALPYSQFSQDSVKSYYEAELKSSDSKRNDSIQMNNSSPHFKKNSSPQLNQAIKDKSFSLFAENKGSSKVIKDNPPLVTFNNIQSQIQSPVHRKELSYKDNPIFSDIKNSKKNSKIIMVKQAEEIKVEENLPQKPQKVAKKSLYEILTCNQKIPYEPPQKTRVIRSLNDLFNK